MLTRRKLHTAKDIIRGVVLHRRAVHRNTPALREVYLREYGKCRSRGCVLILKAVRGILHQSDTTTRIVATSQGLATLNNGALIQELIAEHIQRLTRRSRLAYLRDKPCSAKGFNARKRLYRVGNAVIDSVARIEHRQDLAIHTAEVALDNILIAAKLSTMVATHRAVEV